MINFCIFTFFSFPISDFFPSFSLCFPSLPFPSFRPSLYFSLSPSSSVSHTHTTIMMLCLGLFKLSLPKRGKKLCSRDSSILPTSEYCTLVAGRCGWGMTVTPHSWSHVIHWHKKWLHLWTRARSWLAFQLWAGVGLVSSWVMLSSF